MLSKYTSINLHIYIAEFFASFVSCQLYEAVLSPLYVCMVNINIKLAFAETPRKFIIANLYNTSLNSDRLIGYYVHVISSKKVYFP